MTQSLTLSAPDHRLPGSLLNAQGGFVWWYLDALNPAGDGFVLIWSWGLPFLPGYAAAERRGEAQVPSSRPSLNLGVFRGGKLDYYMLREFDPEACSWDGDSTWSFGPNRITTALSEGRRSVVAHLDCSVPGSAERLSGEIRLDGVARQEGPEEKPDPDHDWSPLTGPAAAVANLKLGAQEWQIEGRGYFDRNGGETPLHRLPIDYWIWGRLPFQDTELIYYLVWPSNDAPPTAFGLEIDSGGRTVRKHQLTVERTNRRLGLAGVTWWKTLTIRAEGAPWLTVTHESVLDDGPFYMRYQVRGNRGDEEVLGIGELCVPGQIDRDLHRPLVRMRVQQSDADKDSMWLPLFTGPRHGRIGRLLRSWTRANP